MDITQLERQRGRELESRNRRMAALRGYIRDVELFKDHASAGLATLRLSRPLCFVERTQGGHDAMSEKCQK
jgi:hypothetical protein